MTPNPLADRPPPYALVAFDCDSTLSRIEGIEELARDAPPELAEWTERAMEGEVPLEEVYGRRLELVQPTRADVEAVGRLYVETALPHGRILVAGLRALGIRTCIVSGGLRPPVLALARHLGVSPDDVFAVDVRFDERGRYAGFDEGSPLARAGGKRALLARLSAETGPAALVGDGATDLEAAPALARFVAFGGVVRRALVFGAAAVRCDVPDLAALVPHLLSAEQRDELERSPEHRELMDAARAAL